MQKYTALKKWHDIAVSTVTAAMRQSGAHLDDFTAVGVSPCSALALAENLLSDGALRLTKW